MMFAAGVGHCSSRATPSLRYAPPRQSMEIVRGETIYRNRNAVQSNPATSIGCVASRHGAPAPWRCPRNSGSTVPAGPASCTPARRQRARGARRNASSRLVSAFGNARNLFRELTRRRQGRRMGGQA